MASNAIAFIAGLGTGMLNAQEKKRLQEREAKKDAQDDAVFDSRMDDVREKKKERAALAEAGKTVTVNDSASTLDTSGKPVLYEDPGVASSDFRQARSMAESTGTAMTGSAPVQTVSAGGQAFASTALAKAAADQANTPAGRAQRTAAALYGVGKPAEAMQLEAGSKQAQVADMQLAEQRWRTDLGAAMQGGHDGLAKLLTNTQADGLAQHKVQPVKNADGTITYNLLQEDGTLKPLPQLTFPDTEDGVVHAAYQLDKFVTPAQRMDHNLKTAKEAREGRESDAKAGYYDSMANAKDVAAANPKTGIDRMSEVDKLTLQNLNKQRDTIHTAITKAQAEGSFDDKSPNAGALRTQLAGLNLRERQLTAKYSGEAAPDPLGIRKPAPAPASAGGAKTGAVTGSGTAKEGQVDILNQEMTKATAARDKPGITADERTRAEADIASLTKELQRLGVKAGAPAPSMAATAGVAAPAAAPAPVAKAKAPAPSPAPAQAVAKAETSPVEAAGQQLDGARAALKALQSQPRPGLAAGRPAIDAYAAKVDAAKTAVVEAEAIYAKALPKQGAAFVHRPI